MRDMAVQGCPALVLGPVPAGLGLRLAAPGAQLDFWPIGGGRAIQGGPQPRTCRKASARRRRRRGRRRSFHQRPGFRGAKLDHVRLGQRGLRGATQLGQPLGRQPVARIGRHRLGIEAPGRVLVALGVGDLAQAVIGILRPRCARTQRRQIVPPRLQQLVLAAIDIGAVVVRGGQNRGLQRDRGGIILGGVLQLVLPVQQEPALQQCLGPLIGRQGVGLDGSGKIHHGVLGRAQKLVRQPAVQQQPAALQRRDALFRQRCISQALGLDGVAGIQGGANFRDQRLCARRSVGGYGQGRRRQTCQKGSPRRHKSVNPLKLDSNLGAVP